MNSPRTVQEIPWFSGTNSWILFLEYVQKLSGMSPGNFQEFVRKQFLTLFLHKLSEKYVSGIFTGISWTFPYLIS